MPERQEEFGIIGLGKMGGGLALQALEKKMKVYGFDLKVISEELLDRGLIHVQEFKDFKEKLARPRAVFVYIPAGSPVDKVIDQLAEELEEGDVIVDGGNSYWGDSIRRAQRMQQRGMRYVDLGTSGGLSGARHGACFMAGGEPDGVNRIEPICRELAAPGGWVHAGGSGAGHFVKLVHNGIEFGMLQAIGEGVDLLTHYHEELDILPVLRCWNNGTVIRSWLIDLMAQMYQEMGGLGEAPSYIEDTGEVNWLVDDAMKMEAPIPVIAQSIMQLFTSRDEDKNWARAIAMMRRGFGGHPLGPDEAVRRERRKGRVGGFYEGDGERQQPAQNVPLSEHERGKSRTRSTGR